MNNCQRKRVENFLGHAILDMIEYGVNIKTTNKKHFNDKTSGSFCSEPLEFRYATGKDSLEDWLGVFVHEYAHFKQWRNGAAIWHDEEANKAYTDYFCYNYKTTKKRQIIVQSLEQDCEKRAVKIMRDFDLPINIDKYIQLSNVYIWYYNAVTKKKSWGNSNVSLSEITEAAKMCPTYFIGSDKYTKPPKNFVKLIINKCWI